MAARIVAVMIALVLLAAGGWKAYVEGRKEGRAQVQALWDKERTALVDAHVKQLEDARRREQELQANMDKLRKEKADEASRLTADYESLLERVRERPAGGSCAAGAAATSSAPGPAACTGAQLSAGDSEDLVRLAQRADEIRLFAQQCWNAYRAASGQ